MIALAVAILFVSPAQAAMVYYRCELHGLGYKVDETFAFNDMRPGVVTLYSPGETRELPFTRAWDFITISENIGLVYETVVIADMTKPPYAVRKTINYLAEAKKSDFYPNGRPAVFSVMRDEGACSVQ
jgi:hypothetical protein